jgi:hypothetical protein
VKRSVTFVAIPFPGLIVTVVANATPASQHAATLTLPLASFIICLLSFFEACTHTSRV